MKPETLISLPAILIGAGMIYVGISEVDYIYMFFYALVGSALALMGILFLFLGYSLSSASKAPKKEMAETKSEDVREAIAETKAAPEEKPTSQMHCPSCGAPILSAGKFCGTCGKPLR